MAKNARIYLGVLFWGQESPNLESILVSQKDMRKHFWQSLRTPAWFEFLNQVLQAAERSEKDFESTVLLQFSAFSVSWCMMGCPLFCWRHSSREPSLPHENPCSIACLENHQQTNSRRTCFLNLFLKLPVLLFFLFSGRLIPWPILNVNGLHFRKWSWWLFMPYISISVMHSAAGVHMEMLVILTEWRPLQIRDRKHDIFSLFCS